MGALRDLLGDYDKNVTLSKRGWKASCTARLQASAVEGEEAKDAVMQEENNDGEWATGPGAEIQAELHEIEADKKYLISLTRKAGEGLVFAQTAAGIRSKFADAVKGK